MEVRFPFLIRRRCPFRTAKATSKAEGMYCLYTAWRALRFSYAARVSPGRDRMFSLGAIRIDSFTRRRNSARSQARRGSFHGTEKTRARWASTPLLRRSQGQGSWGRCPNVKIAIDGREESPFRAPPSFITRGITRVVTEHLRQKLFITRLYRIHRRGVKRFLGPRVRSPSMVTKAELEEKIASQGEYKHGFVTDIEEEFAPKGLSEDIVRYISEKKDEPEWLLEWRLRAYRHWLTMKEPKWANIHYGPIDYQNTYYYAAPKKKPKSFNEVDPEIRAMYEKLGIPLQERDKLAGVAVDAVFDSVSVATTFKEKLNELGIIFSSFSDAVKEHPDLVRKWLGSVVPYNDNFFAALNSAVFSDGSFAYVPPGVRCPMELSTYFRINAASTGQFERTLIIADKGAYVSYLEGCSAPMRDENQLHAAVVELIALDNAQIKYSTIQNWYPGDEEGRGGIYNFVTKRG